KARIVYFPESETVKQIKPLRSLRGISKGMDTMDAYFERKRTDKALEDSIDESGRYENSRYRK
ncbi:MAG: hypothetical protein LBQ57_13265, partial [Spirochaetales bacterium]|nr:hypothetical protein [Spirochaetales bacterium]